MCIYMQCSSIHAVTVGTAVIGTGSTDNPQIGENYTLSCTVSGVDILKDSQPVYEYFWIKDGSFIRYFESTPFYTIDSLEFDDAGNYQCWSVVTFNRRIGVGAAGRFSPNFQLHFTGMLYTATLITHTMACMKLLAMTLYSNDKTVREANDKTNESQTCML